MVDDDQAASVSATAATDPESPGAASYMADDDGSALPEPTSTQLIAAALEAGDIDEPTALLYRTHLLFGYPALPAEYQGAAEAHDLGLIAQLRERLGELPDDIRAQIEPYLLRPTDPASIFSTGLPPGLRAAGTAIIDAPDPADPKTGPPCPTWKTEAVAGQPFRVWVCESLDESGLDGATHAMDIVTGVVAAHAGQLIADMGAPIPDDPATDSDPRADEAIDIYVLPAGWMGPVRAGEAGSAGFGDTISVAPYHGVTASAYVLMAADHLADRPLFERMLVHEMFHVLQYAHNARLDSWYIEASAEWSSSYYVRDDSARLYEKRVPVAQDTLPGVSLTSPVGLRPYGAHVWPLFMEQQAGAPAVFDSWVALETLPRNPPWQDVITAISGTVDMGTSFPEFAMRLLNADLPGDPIRPRFVDLDGHFPDGRLPAMAKAELTKDPLDINVSRLEGLGYRYYRIAVPQLPDVLAGAEVTVNISGTVTTRDGAAPTLAALPQGGDGHYSRAQVDLGGTDLCVAGEVLLVLSNDSIDALDNADGTLTLRRDATKPCQRVEVTHPTTQTRLADGEPVRAGDVEEDGKPGTAPIAVTVFGVDAKDIADFEVVVVVDGDTLMMPQQFTWPLADFTASAADDYRKNHTIALDFDLTDDNRDLTIGARLLRAGDTVHEHAAVAELHGERPCVVDDPDVNCELVGDLSFAFRGDFDSGPQSHPVRHFFDAEVAGTLSVRLGESARLPGPRLAGYPDVGTAWTMSGSARFERCEPGAGGSCPGNVVSQQFTTGSAGELDDAEAAMMAAIGFRDGMLVYLTSTAQGPLLMADVPVTVVTSIAGVGQDGIEPHATTTWQLGCPLTAEDSFETNSGFWQSDTSFDQFRLPVGEKQGAYLSWNEAGTAFSVDCRQQWQPQMFNVAGTSGSMTYQLTGTLRWVRAGG
jgi:hypothetical protein